MPRTARVGDQATGCGGVVTITSGSPKVIDKGQRTARVGDSGVCTEHGDVVIETGNAKVKDDGQPTASIGDKFSCGAVIISGANNVIDGGG